MGSKKGKELDIAQQISFLKKINFFNEFGDEELLSFLSVSRWLKVPAGKLIIKEETSDRIFYILVKGEVSVFKTIDDKGATVELTTLTTGDCFGEMSMVMEIKRSAGVKTTMESFILMVEPDIISASNVFLQLKFYKRFCEILVSRLILANKRVTGLEPQDEETEQEEKTAPAVEEKEPEKEKTSAEHAITATEEEKAPEKPVDPATLPPVPLAEEKFGRSRIQRMLSPEQNMVVNPAVAAELSSFLAQESTSNTRKFADLIVLDPVLSAKILQIANSSFYRRSNAVVSVPHAMITLGIEHILTVVMETLESSRYKHPFSGFPKLSKSFWEHAVVVGRIAEL
ncbi:MAG: HDOD domain-containing protein, partial [Desulfobulbaceae bacterium]|nr:HDOD domain-containing protein [Desulfobulbaceae bacterium]